MGLHTYASANNIDVIDSVFEGNVGVGIFASGGAQLLYSGNVLEGNGGPGIIVFGAMGVEIVSNYYEANCEPCSAGRWCDDRFKKMYVMSRVSLLESPLRYYITLRIYIYILTTASDTGTPPSTTPPPPSST